MDRKIQTVKPAAVIMPRGAKRLAIVTMILLVFFTILPDLLRIAANHWLNQQRQVHSFSIDDIDLNLFSGEVGLKGISVSGNSADPAQLGHLYLNLSMLALLQQRIEIKQLSLTGLDLAIVQNSTQDLFIAGIPLPTPSADKAPESSEKSDWGIGIQSVTLADLNLQFSSSQFATHVELQTMSLGAVSTWQADQAAEFILKAKIQEAPLIIEGRLKPFANQAHAQVQLQLDKLPLNFLKTIATEQGLNGLGGALSLNLEIDGYANGPVQLKSQLLVDDLALSQDKYHIALKQIDWQGDIHYEANNNAADLGVRTQGSLSLSKLNVSDQLAKIDLLDLETMSVQSIVLAENQQASIEKISLNKLAFLTKENESLAQLETLAVHQLNYDGQQSIRIDKINLDTLVANIAINSAGQIPLIEAMSADQTDTVEAEKLDEPIDSPVWRVQLAQINIANDSRIQFHDQSVSPPYKADISPLVINMRDIDTVAPKQDISFTLTTEINQLTSLSLDAKIQPFGEHLNVIAEAELQNLDLPPLSPYAVKAMGYYLERGQANMSLKATVKEDQLDSKIKLKLNKFTLEAGDPDKVKSMNENLSMPLDLALNILRDKKDNIELELKIDGDINDPQFDASKVINKALGNATKYAAVYVLKQSLQPWGTVFSVVSFLGKKITTPHFEAVEFSAGSSELSDEHKQYMAKMGTLLNERPELDLNICASASEQDRLALSPQIDAEPTAEEAQIEEKPSPEPPLISNQILLDLAQRRMDLIRAALIEQGADKGHLFNCHPSMNNAEKAKPSVELYL